MTGLWNRIKKDPGQSAGFLRGQRGFTLLEMLMAVAIMGFIGVAVMGALGTGYRSRDITKEQVTGENLVRAALEEIRDMTYQNSASPSPYNPTVPVPAGYSISVTTVDFCTPEPCTPDGNIQKNTVKVSRDGDTVVFVEDLKTRR